MHKLNTIQKSKQYKIEQNRTTLVQSPLTTLGTDRQTDGQTGLGCWDEGRTDEMAMNNYRRRHTIDYTIYGTPYTDSSETS